MQADVTVVDDMVRVRQALKLGESVGMYVARYTESCTNKAWGGIDTVIMCAGVSSLSPLLEAAGVHEAGQEADAADIGRVLRFSDAAMRANMNGPLVSALALVRRSIGKGNMPLTNDRYPCWRRAPRAQQ